MREHTPINEHGSTSCKYLHAYFDNSDGVVNKILKLYLNLSIAQYFPLV